MSFSIRAQNKPHATYQHPKIIPPSFQLFYTTDSVTINDDAVEKLSKKAQLKYINNYKQQLKFWAESGLVYFNWMPVETYLNDLLFKLIPDSLKNKIQPKVFVKKDITNNAMSMPNGHIYINVGLLANLKSEPALAFIIAHELAHYLKKHHIKNYKQTLLKNNSKSKLGFYRFTHNNKHLEIEADEVAINLLVKQNIPIVDAIDVFKLMQNKGKVFNLTSMRLYFIEKKVSQIAKKTTQSKSNIKFSEISQLCKNEFFSVLLEKNYYLSCIKLGLSISDENNFYKIAYFTAEAIRRYLLLYPNCAHKNIKTVLAENATESNIFTFDSINNNTLQKKLITVFQELAAVTNRQQNPELLFTNALYEMQNLQNQSQAKTHLNNYLVKENIEHALLAKHLFETEQEDQPGNVGDQVILVDVITSFKQTRSKQQVAFENQAFLNTTINPKLKQWLYAKYTGYKIVFVEDLIKTNFNTAIRIQNFFSKQDTTLLDVKSSLFLLEPEAFDLFERLEASSIQYLKIETSEGSKLENDNVFNPLSLPYKLKYLLRDKHLFSIKQVSVKPNGFLNIKQNTFTGKANLRNITSYFKEIIE